MLPVCTTQSGQAFAFPDVCKTPTPGGPVPMPYPNIGMLMQSNGTTTKVKIMGKPAVLKKSKIPRSSGDEAGNAGGGVVSNVFMNQITFKKGSSKVKLEGSPVVHLTAPTGQNGSNPNTVGAVVAPSQTKVLVMP